MSKSKLNQIIAVVNGKKSRGQKDLTEIYKKLQKQTLFDGLSRTYQPLDEEGETQPPETKNIQYKANQAMEEARAALLDLFDVTATQDWANCQAKADVKVEGQVILESVPVTYLLFVEKQLIDLHTFVGQLPTLDPAESWHWDENADCFASETTFSNRTKKVPRSHVLVEPTEHHPAQAEMYHEDVKVGEWRTTKFSSALPAQERNEILGRIRKLQEAVKFAREKANSMEIEEIKTGNKVFDFVFRAQS
ncbi:MAG: hypothetical protein COA78_03920 [Blastopirellula sp.]|nr:MAG: hypothetical protein COA78_03920 [Blastopirellula sp.]